LGFSGKVLWIALTLAALILGTLLALPRHQTLDTTAQAGDVKRGADGQLLYFNGRVWDTKPLPAQDSPF
jgi:hypothetical protein